MGFVHLTKKKALTFFSSNHVMGQEVPGTFLVA